MASPPPCLRRSGFAQAGIKGEESSLENWMPRSSAAGYFTSATPALIYSPPHQEAIRRAPIEKVLLETDTPVSYQGREARPKDARITLKEVDRLKKLDPFIVAEQTTANASKFFQIP